MKRVLALGAVIAVVAFGFMLVRDPGPLPLLDANRTILAESYEEGYCAGLVYVSSNGLGDLESAKHCWEANNMNTDRDLQAVQRAFCVALNTKVSISVQDCVGIMKGRQFWPAKDGSLAWQWNRRFPYPGLSIETEIESDTSRTGGRDDFERTGGDR